MPKKKRMTTKDGEELDPGKFYKKIMYRNRGLYTVFFWYSKGRVYWYQVEARSPRDCLLKMLKDGRKDLVEFGVSERKIEMEYKRYKHGDFGEKEEPTLMPGCINIWHEGVMIGKQGVLEVWIVKTARRREKSPS